jgi:hypothetical protein
MLPVFQGRDNWICRPQTCIPLRNRFVHLSCRVALSQITTMKTGTLFMTFLVEMRHSVTARKVMWWGQRRRAVPYVVYYFRRFLTDGGSAISCRYLPPVELKFILSTYLLLYSPLLGLGRFSVSLPFTQSVGFLGWGISPSQGRYLHTG